MDVDFAKLGSRTTIAQQVWVAGVEMAISIAKVARDNFCTQETLLLLRLLSSAEKGSPLPHTLHAY